MTPNDDRDFWLDIGTKLGMAAEVCAEFKKFRDNEFAHLEKKVDNLTKYVWIAVGIFIAFQVVLKFAF